MSQSKNKFSKNAVIAGLLALSSLSTSCDDNKYYTPEYTPSGELKYSPKLHTQNTTYPVEKEMELRVTLINSPESRCAYRKQNGVTYLITCLKFDADGDHSTFEYWGLDFRSSDVCGIQNLREYESAIKSLKVGDNRTMKEWQEVIPNLYLAKYYSKPKLAAGILNQKTEQKNNLLNENIIRFDNKHLFAAIQTDTHTR